MTTGVVDVGCIEVSEESVNVADGSNGITFNGAAVEAGDGDALVTVEVMVKVDKELFVTAWLKCPLLLSVAVPLEVEVVVGESDEGELDEQREKDEVEDGDFSEPLILILEFGDIFFVPFTFGLGDLCLDKTSKLNSLT